MIAGCYTLQLYCARGDKGGEYEVPELVGNNHFNNSMMTFTDEYGATCRKGARQAGWLFLKDGDVICPACVKAMKAEKRAKE